MGILVATIRKGKILPFGKEVIEDQNKNAIEKP
jgi:hypothetical protein